MESMNEALRQLVERKKFSEEQLDTYHNYVETAMNTMQKGKEYDSSKLGSFPTHLWQIGKNSIVVWPYIRACDLGGWESRSCCSALQMPKFSNARKP